MNKIKNKLVPELRFPAFEDDGEWDYFYGNKLFKTVSNKNHNSELPILAITQDQGAIPREEINYHVSVSKKSVEGYKVVEVGDFIISLRSFQGGIEYSNHLGICSPAYIILRRKKKNLLNLFYKQYFKTDVFISHLNKNLEGIRDGKMVSYKQFSEIKIPQPQTQEQQKIADCIASLDELILGFIEKLEALKRHKRGLMQNLFPQDGLNVPNYRFAEFKNDKEWEKTTLGKITNVISNKNKDNKNLPVYSINNKDGFLPQSEQFDDMNSKRRGYDISLYKIIEKNTFAYNPARINVGSIGYSGNLNNILISSLYVCFKTENIVDDKFLNQYLETPYFLKLVNRNTEGGIRSYLFYKNFSKITISLPSMQEQQKIATCLTSMDDLISAQQNKIAQIEQHKKGLLQGLFPKVN
ncbi:restriction endonuclease subunit S [Christiangramia forsetii]|nr:restriction endonuclease subunit S [Christiangramia forsetii]GGG37536.1 restriction endonuclease [Christiangramia forsetii]